jgi:TetR/AcrR family transcriptional regulator, cholesterol catabolism regulator
MTSGIGKRRAAARDEGGAAYHERRTEIVRAAAEMFKRNGYRGTKLGDVAEAMNLDRASLYYYVGSKEELFHEVVGGAVEANADSAEAILAGPGTAPEKLRALITGLMVSYGETYPFLYVYIQENLGTVSPDRSDWAREMRRHNKRYENAVVAIVQAGIDEGSLQTGTQAWVVAYGIIGMVAWSNRWFNPNESAVPAEEIGAAYAETVLRGLQV